VTSPTRRFFGATLLAVLALAARPAAAPADEPATFIAVGPLYYDSSTYIDKNGHTQSSGCDFQKRGESIYVQQRLSTSDSARLSTEYDDVSCGGPSTRGLNDIELDYLHGLGGPAHPTQFSIEGSVILPPGYSIAVNPRIGLGRPGAELGTVYLQTFQAGTHYGYVTAAINARAYSGYPAPQLLSTVTAGYHLTNRLLAYESFYGVTHLGAGGQLTNIGLNPLVNSSYDSYTLAENVAVDLSAHTAIALSYTSLVGGWNTGIGSTLQAGVWLRF
jgi:hypothetical protein